MPTPETLWQRLVDEAGEDAVEEAVDVSVAQAERDLAAAGFDVKAERAHAAAVVEKLRGGERTRAPAGEPTMDGGARGRPAAPSPRPSRASRRVVWLVAALLAAATAGGIFYAASRPPPPRDKPVDAPSATASPPPATRDGK
jgi:hypothetical protein